MMKLVFDPLLYLVVGRSQTRGRDLLEVVDEAVAGGVTLVQIREKEASPRDFLELALALKRLLANRNVPLIVNDSMEVTLLAGAEGLHIGQSDTRYSEARRVLGDEAIIGLSVENMEQAMAAEALEVDYLGVGPIFATSTKPDAAEPWGLQALAGLHSVSRHVLVGIGGINPENAPEVMRAGACGVAVISAICSADSPRGAAESLRRAMKR